MIVEIALCRTPIEGMGSAFKCAYIPMLQQGIHLRYGGAEMNLKIFPSGALYYLGLKMRLKCLIKGHQWVMRYHHELHPDKNCIETYKYIVCKTCGRQLNEPI